MDKTPQKATFDERWRRHNDRAVREQLWNCLLAQKWPGANAREIAEGLLQARSFLFPQESPHESATKRGS